MEGGREEPTDQSGPVLYGDVMGVTANAKLGTPALPPPWFPGERKEKGASRGGVRLYRWGGRASRAK